MPILITKSASGSAVERLIEDQVQVIFTPEILTFSTGTLAITESFLQFHDSNCYLTIDYPTIVIHAISNEDPVANKACVYLQLGTNVVNADDGFVTTDAFSTEDEVPIEIRIIPADPGKISQIYQIIGECSQLNPDTANDLQGEWITAENVDSFIANAAQEESLERLGSLIEAKNENGKRNAKEISKSDVLR